MQTINRTYLQTLKKVMGTPDIKVITGVRRSGKSMLLRSLEEHIAREIHDANIIRIDFSDINFEPLQEYHALNDYIESKYLEGHHNFLLIDEVQTCRNFEKTINSLHNSMKYDIYLTGSNAFLLSSDLRTLFTGRVFPIEIFPFSFKEYLSYHHPSTAPNHTNQNRTPEPPDHRYDAFDRYLLDGGFAGSYLYDDQPEKYRYISEVYDTIILCDIEQKYSVQNPEILRKVSDYLLDNTSRLSSGRKITDILNSDGQDTNNKIVGRYIDHLCNSFAFYKVKRYDIEGKNYLRSNNKYYLADHTFKYAKLGTKNLNFGSTYENIVAIELLRRGYEIYVGTLRDKEIDFVARRRDEKLYIQVSYDISEESTFAREITPLLSIRDAYPKLIIARTRQPEQQYEGVRILDIADWLLAD